MTQNTNIEKCPTTPSQVERVRPGRTYVPRVDIIEKAEELLLIADVPGANPGDLDIQYENGKLSLTARVTQREENGHNYLLREYGVGDFVRAFEIGEGIDPSRIEAEMKNGVVTIRLPKTEAVKPHKINVKLN